MKKGDRIIIKDSSYSKVVTNHGLESSYGDGKICDIRKKQGIIVETSCSFPDRHEYQTQIHTYNDTVVVLDSGEIVFIEERFLSPMLPTHKVMVDIRQDGGWMYGQIVEISDELYKQIKK